MSSCLPSGLSSLCTLSSVSSMNGKVNEESMLNILNMWGTCEDFQLIFQKFFTMFTDHVGYESVIIIVIVISTTWQHS